MLQSRYYDGAYISVTELKEMAYCPVIPWIHAHLGYRTDPTPSMESGQQRVDADYKEAVAEELGLPRPYRLEVPLRSPRLGLSGVVDVIAGSGTYTVLEVKAFKRPRGRWRHYRLQLLAYALLVMDTLGPVREAILYMGGETLRIPVSERVVQETLKAIERLNVIIRSEDPPRPNIPSAKCTYCWYSRVCPSRPYLKPSRPL